MKTAAAAIAAAVIFVKNLSNSQKRVDKIKIYGII